MQDELEKKTSELNIEEKVIFAGWRNDALKIMQIFDIFILPSLWEAFSVVVLEAMSARKPIIVSDVADHQKIISDGSSGILIPPKDSTAIFDSIMYLLENPEKAANMAEKAYQFYKSNFTINKMTTKYEELYMRVKCT